MTQPRRRVHLLTAGQVSGRRHTSIGVLFASSASPCIYPHFSADGSLIYRQWRSTPATMSQSSSHRRRCQIMDESGQTITTPKINSSHSWPLHFGSSENHRSFLQFDYFQSTFIFSSQRDSKLLLRVDRVNEQNLLWRTALIGSTFFEERSGEVGGTPTLFAVFPRDYWRRQWRWFSFFQGTCSLREVLLQEQFVFLFVHLLVHFGSLESHRSFLEFNYFQSSSILSFQKDGKFLLRVDRVN